MKKKSYIQPSVTCTKIATIGIIATSQSLGDATNYSSGGSISGARSSGFPWDDDEDEY